MGSRSILSVPIESTSNVDNHLTNNITIRNYAVPETEVKYEDTVYNDLTPPPQPLDSVSEYLLTLYKSILLNGNKELLANLVSRNRIILTKEDLEEVVKRKVGKRCTVQYEDPEATCCGLDPVFLKIVSIRVFDESIPNGVDFVINYNKEYLELVTEHQLCTDFVLVN